MGNHGLNSQLKTNPTQPVTLYAKDFDGNGSLDPILCSYIMGEEYPVFSKDDLLEQLSFLKSRYVTYADYANQKITDIFDANELDDTMILKAKVFESSYLENLGAGKFKLSSLPSVAQFAPVYGVLAHDVDQDGNLDLILAGNFFGSRVKYGRYDANKGLLLLGDGKGKFKPIPQTKSGFNVSNEVRDIVLITSSDNTKWALFAQNNAPLLTYKIQSLHADEK